MDGGTAISEMLLNAPPLVAFAGYLIWQSKSQQQRLDKLHENWITQINDLEAKSQKREDALRLRYDEVIQKLEGERLEIAQKYIEVVQNMSAKVQTLSEKINSMALDIKTLMNRINTVENDVSRIKRVK